ncbi:MAG TPA: cytochrome c [Xanthobacteraceae bacterium]|nr:cytochrome c [Xanthobacteraceae bacterium]
MPENKRSLVELARPLLLAAALSVPAGAVAAAGVDKQDFSQIQRGHYLAIVGDCAACHTLPGSGHALAGGRPIETPFGTMFAPNITPDPTTGVGAWTDQEFVDAMTKGTGRNGMHLYPAMPYTYYTKVTRDDALAIRAYLNTVPAVHNPVKADQLPFPFNIRASMIVWNELFFSPEQFQQRADKSDEWNRGAYLAEGLGHCGLCHTPKNFMGGDKTSERLQGYALQGWFASDITNDRRRGIGGWSVDEIADYLKTGHGRKTLGTGLMAETISQSTSNMTDADLKAIAVYLKDQPGQSANENQDRTQAVAADQAIMKRGARIYADECSGCHAGNGKGIEHLFPALDGSSVIQQTDPTSLMHVVLRGARSVGTDKAPTAAAMPEFGWLLNDSQVAAVLTYIRNSWGNAAPAVSADEVRKARHVLVQRSD